MTCFFGVVELSFDIHGEFADVWIVFEGGCNNQACISQKMKKENLPNELKPKISVASLLKS